MQLFQPIQALLSKIRRLMTTSAPIQTDKPSGASAPPALLGLKNPYAMQQPIALATSETRASSAETATEKEPDMSSVLSNIENAVTKITAVASAISSAVEVLSTSTAIQAGWDQLKTLYTATAALMEQVEAAYQAGADKKAKVLAVIQVLATKLGINWTSIATIVSGWVDTIKAAYNAVLSAVAPVKASIQQPAAPAPVQQIAPAGSGAIPGAQTA